MIGHLVLHSPEVHPAAEIADADVVLFGVPRSATAMVFQLLQGLFPFGGVIYTHSFIAPPQHVWCLGTYRDFRACVVSHWRYETNAPAGTRMGGSETRRFAGRMLEFVCAMEHYNERGNTTWLRYEEHLGDPRTILTQLSPDYTKFTGQKIPPPFWERAARYMSRTPHQARIEAGQVPVCKRNHIQDGSCDGWRQWVTPEGAGLLTDILAKPLSRWGYAL